MYFENKRKSFPYVILKLHITYAKSHDLRKIQACNIHLYKFVQLRIVFLVTLHTARSFILQLSDVTSLF